MIAYAQKTFNAGLFHPKAEARSDYAKYDNGCRTLQNMLPETTGPASRTPGTKHIASVKTASKKVRLERFEFSKTDVYVLEFGDLYIRFYREQGQILSGISAYEVVTTYTEAELFDIQVEQHQNKLYLWHADHKPATLTRASHTSWTLANLAYTNGPFKVENSTATTMTPSATTGTITLTASTNTFNADHVGSLWQINHRVTANAVSGTLSANGNSSTLPIGGGFTIKTAGTWTGIITVQRSDDNGVSWEDTEFQIRSTNDGNLDDGGNENEVGVIYRVNMSSYSSGSCTYTLTALTYIHKGSVSITVYTSEKVVTGTVQTTLYSTDATDRWSDPFWSDYEGWPQCGCVHEGRLWHFSTATYPQAVFGSAIPDSGEDFTDMLAGAEDDDAIIYTLPGQNPIQWGISQTYLMLGTLAGAGRLGHETEPITPDNPSYRGQSKNGSAYIKAVEAGDSILYVERGGRRIREYVYTLERDKFITPDLSVLADHILKVGIVQIAFQNRPDTILWCVLNDGNIATLTFNREQEITAWGLQVTDGSFESVTVVPGDDEDEVWVAVQRTINSATARYIELFQPRDWGDDDEDAWFVDSGLKWDGGDAVNITNVTKANPAVVTFETYPVDGDGDSLTDGTQIYIESVAGMTELNGRVFTISNPNVGNKTAELRNSADDANIDSSAYTTYDSGGTAQGVVGAVSGLDHLEGETLIGWCDKSNVNSLVVSSGSVSLGDYYNTVVVGMPKSWILETMPVVAESPKGSTLGRYLQGVDISIDLYKTYGLNYGVNSSTYTAMKNSDGEILSNWYHGKFPFGNNDKLTAYLFGNDAGPVTIRSLVIGFQING